MRQLFAVLAARAFETSKAARASDPRAPRVRERECAAAPSAVPLIDRVRRSVIGDDALLDGPFGRAPPRVRGPHGVRSLAVVHRGLHPRPRPAAVREHAHRGIGDGAPDHGAARGRPPHHPRGGERRRRRRRHLLRLGHDGRDRQARPSPRPRRAAAGAAGRLHRPLRAPLERAAVAGVERRCRHHPRGRRRTDRHRPPRSRAPPPRASTAEGGQLLRRVERHRDRLGRRPARDRRCTATARSPAGTTRPPAPTSRST